MNDLPNFQAEAGAGSDAMPTVQVAPSLGEQTKVDPSESITDSAPYRQQ